VIFDSVQNSLLQITEPNIFLSYHSSWPFDRLSCYHACTLDRALANYVGHDTVRLHSIGK